MIDYGLLSTILTSPEIPHNGLRVCEALSVARGLGER